MPGTFWTRPKPFPPHCPLPAGSVRSLTPEGHTHSGTHGPPGVRPARAPSPHSSSCSPSGPLCPCQTLHLSSHLWWEPGGKSPKFTQSIMASQPLLPDEWGGSYRGSLGGGVSVQLGSGDGWALSGCSHQWVRFSSSSRPSWGVFLGPNSAWSSLTPEVRGPIC